MKKLRNKIFGLIFIILSSCLLIILSFFMIWEYQRNYNDIKKNLFRMNKKPIGNLSMPIDKERRFMDTTIYTILLKENKITDIISHTVDGSVDSSIYKEIEKIIKTNDKSKAYIGNLFYEKYSYGYIVNSYITLIDNTEVNNRLLGYLKQVIIIFILIEILFFIVTSKLSTWVTKPVVESFIKQKQFIADASHELKTPLSVIMASAEALENDTKNKKWLKNIQIEADKMNKLIKELLDLAKLDNIKKQYTNNNISKIIEKEILTLESLIYEKNIQLKYEIEPNIELTSSQDEIKQLMTILLDNAIKYSKKDGSIIINLRKNNDIITLEVKNKGESIPKEEQEKIFERFYRLDKSRNRDNSNYGLGLAIAKKIVLNHQGTIKVNSKDGYNIFIITFKKH